MRSYLGSKSYPKIFHNRNCFASITVCYLYILGSYSLGRRNLQNRKQTGRCAAFWKAEKHFRWVYRYWFLRYCEYQITLECHQNLNIQYTSSEFRHNYVPLWVLFRKWGMKGFYLRKRLGKCYMRCIVKFYFLAFIAWT